MKRLVKIAAGLSCEFSYHAGAAQPVTFTWSPSPPDKLTGKSLRRYRRARDEFLSDVGKQLGGRVAVIEAPAELALAITPTRGNA